MFFGTGEDAGAKLLLGQFDAPAYIRRARNVESDFDDLIMRCQRLKREWLNQAERLYEELRCKAGDWQRLERWVSQPEQLAYLRALDGWLFPVLRYPPRRSSWFWGLSRSIETLRGLIRQFNRAWDSHLRQIDLGPINRARDGYNRWYLLEKECSMGSSYLAARGFTPLTLITMDDLLEQFPPLPESGSGAS